jgi:thiamine-monophosphate kinase
MKEAEIVEVIKGAFGSLVAPGAYELADDAAMIPPVIGHRARVVTTDVVVEGVDFDLGLYPAMYAGYRALAQNISDLSAMGAFPVGFVWSLAIPPPWLERERIAELARGAAVLAKLRMAPLFGGDLSATSGPLVVSITAFGDVEGVPIRRAGARPGDFLWLSGPVGGAAAGLRVLRERQRAGPSPEPFEAWLRSLPDALASAVRAHVMPLPGDPAVLASASAAMDVSDGLAIDANRLAAASRVRLELEDLDSALAPAATHEDALHGGEDYALLFTAPPSARVDGLRVGRVVEGEGVWQRGARVEAAGHDHFARLLHLAH